MLRIMIAFLIKLTIKRPVLIVTSLSVNFSRFTPGSNKYFETWYPQSKLDMDKGQT
jgi:hypothetical protein